MQTLLDQINDVIPIQALVPLLIIEFLLILVALVSWFRSETKGPKWLWLIVILFVQIVGPILYFVIGRRND